MLKKKMQTQFVSKVQSIINNVKLVFDCKINLKDIEINQRAIKTKIKIQ